MTNITLAIIVKNEEKNLPRCLSSVRDFVSEIALLDTGSTDKTVAIAEDFGAKIYHFTWCNNFAMARNYLLPYLTGEWILVLDADEVLNSNIIPHLTSAITSPQNLVVNLIRQEVGASQSPYSLVSRLFRRHTQLRFTRPYHAIIDDSVEMLLKLEPDWKIVELPDIAIFHYGYQAQAITSQDKYTKARQTMEEFYRTNPRDPYVCSKLGALYVQIGQVKRGLKLLIRGLKAKQLPPAIMFELHYHLANAYVKEQNLPLALHHYQLAITAPILPLLKLGAYNNLAGLLKETGDFANAQQIYQLSLKIDPSFAMGYYNLGMTFKSQGKFPEAINAYHQAIQLKPDYAEAYQNLGVVLLKIGQLPQSLEAFQVAITLHQSQNPQEAARLRQGLLEMGF